MPTDAKFASRYVSGALAVFAAALTQRHEFGVRWKQFDRNDRLVTKERIFTTEKARERFVAKVSEQDNFHSFTAWTED